MNFNIEYLSETSSTNDVLRARMNEQILPEGYTVSTDFQTAGRGQATNKWESERGKNLLFSTLFRPKNIELRNQFLFSKAIALGIQSALEELLGEKISIKWPNDIYWNDRKLCGILIETEIFGGKMEQAIVGIGINVNQTTFVSNAPNPVSMNQIAGHEFDRKMVLEKILEEMLATTAIEIEELECRYFSALYRNNGYFPFRKKGEKETFFAKILEVKPNGFLVVETKTDQRCEFFFKEVEFVI